MTTRLLLAAVAATASLAACAGEPSSETPGSQPTGSRESENRKAMLDYARCMRKNGVEMPDPQFDGGLVMQNGPSNADPAKMNEAEEACAEILKRTKPPEMSDEQKTQFKQQALEHAKCMRENGVDFPDPTFDKDGGVQIKIERGAGFDPQSPKFREADKACRKHMPGAGTTESQGG